MNVPAPYAMRVCSRCHLILRDTEQLPHSRAECLLVLGRHLAVARSQVEELEKTLAALCPVCGWPKGSADCQAGHP